MIVTDIVPIDQKKKRVCIDHDYAFPLYLSEIRKFHIEEGVSISDQAMDEIRQLLTTRLKERILYYITDADHSERDIRRKMLQAYYPEDLVNDCMERLKEFHYIDDERYAMTYIDSMLAQKKSRTYIQNKLYEKGISKELIEQLLAEYEFDETPFIYDLLRKKGYTKELISSITPKDKQKLYAYLMRKGFRSSDIGRALSEGDFLVDL